LETEVGVGSDARIEKLELTQLNTIFQHLRDDIGKARSGHARNSMSMDGSNTVGFNFNGVAYALVLDECRIISDQAQGVQRTTFCRAELVFRRHADRDQRWIKVTYTLYSEKGRCFLAFIGNPTTVVNGTNIRPVRVVTDSDDDVGQFTESLQLFRLGFDLLVQVLWKYKFSWSERTEKRLAAGKIRVANAQWALYLPTDNKQSDMALLSGLYAARAISATGSSALGEYLGFEINSVMKDERGDLTGLFLLKRAGTNHNLSINFYDKRASVANKKQSNAIAASEIELITNAIRLDITGHPLFLNSIIADAKDQAAKLLKVKPEWAGRLKGALSQKIVSNRKPTAYSLCRAMTILSFYIDKKNNLSKPGFAAWLIDRVLTKELRLPYLLACVGNVPKLDTRGNKLMASAIELWRKMRPTEVTVASMSKLLGDKLSLSPKRTRALLREIQDEHGIDLRVPYIYWHEAAGLSLTYGLTLEEAAKVQESIFVPDGDPAKRIALIDKMMRKRKRQLIKSTNSLRNSLELKALPVRADKYLPSNKSFADKARL